MKKPRKCKASNCKNCYQQDCLKKEKQGLKQLPSDFPKYKCTVCGDILQSKYSGEFVACRCFMASHEAFDKIVEEKQLTWHDPEYAELITKIITGGYIDCTEHYTRGAGTIERIE